MNFGVYQYGIHATFCRHFLAGLIIRLHQKYLMELVESVSWVLAGFIPTLAGLEVAYRIRTPGKSKLIGKGKVGAILKIV